MKEKSISELIEKWSNEKKFKKETIQSFSEYEGIDKKFKLNTPGQVDDKLRELVKTTRKRAIRNLRKNFQIRLNYSLQEDILENYNFKINRILENNLYGYIKIIKDNIYENFHFFSYWFGKNWADLEVSLIGQVIESTGTSKKIIELNLHNNINAWFDVYWHLKEKKKFELIAGSIIANLPKDIENNPDELKKLKKSDKLFLFWEEVLNQYNEKEIDKIQPMKEQIKILKIQLDEKKAISLLSSKYDIKKHVRSKKENQLVEFIKYRDKPENKDKKCYELLNEVSKILNISNSNIRKWFENHQQYLPNYKEREHLGTSELLMTITEDDVIYLFKNEKRIKENLRRTYS